jgi:hypothetical protein
MDPEVTTGLELKSKVCSKCGAKWLNGQHYWSTGFVGDPETLSNLVCGLVESNECINKSHKRGHIYGDKDTWEKRSKFIQLKTKGY